LIKLSKLIMGRKRIIVILFFCAFFVSAEQSHAAFSWEDNIIVHYKMNDNAETTTVIDNKGFANGTAQQNTSALHTDGKIIGALEFNGTSDYIATAEMDEQPSVAFWYKESGSEDWIFVANSSGTTYVNGVEDIPVQYPVYKSWDGYSIGGEYYGEQGEVLTPFQSYEGKIDPTLAQIGTDDFSMGFWFRTGEQNLGGYKSPDYFAFTLYTDNVPTYFASIGWYQNQHYLYGKVSEPFDYERSYSEGTVSSAEDGWAVQGYDTNWLDFDSTIDWDYPVPIHIDDTDETDSVIWILQQDYLWTEGQLSPFTNSNYTISYRALYTPPISEAQINYTPGDVWHFLFMTVDRDDPEGLKLWLDGVVVATADPTDFEDIDLSPDETGVINLNFGAIDDGFFIQNQWFDDFQLYIDKVLSEEDILYLYNNRNGRRINEDYFASLVSDGFYVDFNGVTDGTYPGAIGGGYSYGVQMRKLVGDTWDNATISFADYGGKDFSDGGLPLVDGEFFNGSIDDFMFFDNALSDDEVAELYNLGDGTENEYEISGRVTLSGGTADVTDVLLTLSGATGETTHPDADGDYSFTCWERFDYIITPSLEDYYFFPGGYSYPFLEGNQPNQDFMGVPLQSNISGSNDNDDEYRCFLTNVFAAGETDGSRMLCEIRNFRDSYLLTNPMGEMLVSAYYKTSPTLAEFIKECPILKNTARRLFHPLLWINEKITE